MDDGGTGASSAPASLSSKSPPPQSSTTTAPGGGGSSGGGSGDVQKDKSSLSKKPATVLENGHAVVKRERERDRDKERKRQRQRERERERRIGESHGSSSASTDDAAGGDSSDAETVILPLSERRPLKKLKRIKRSHPRINDDDDNDSSSDDESRGVKLKDRRRQKEDVRRRSIESKKPSSRSASPSMAAASASSLQPMRKDGSPIRDASGRLMLQKLCDKGDYERAKTLLQVGVDVNDRDYAGNTAIHDAALKGHTRIVELLLDNGAIIDIRSGVGDLDTPLIDAASRSRVEVVKLLLDRGADPRIFNAQGKTALDSLPAEDPNHDEIEKMLKVAAFKLRKQRRDSNAGSGSGNDSDLNGKPQPNAEDFDPSKSVPGTFPDPNLHKDKQQVEEKTSSNGGPRRRGARSQSIRNDLLWMDLTTRTGREMVYRKAADGDIQFVGRSLEEGWQPDGDCLVLAAKHGHTELVSLILAFGGHSDAVNEDGETALEQTIGRGHIETVKLLLKSGADPLRRDRKGRSYYDIAREAVGSDDEEAVLIHDAIENANNGKPPAPKATTTTNNNETTTKNNSTNTTTNTLTTTNSNDDRKRRDESEIDRKLKKRKLKREREEREREREREREKERERESSKQSTPGPVAMKRVKSDEQRAKLSKDKKRALTEEERKKLKVEEMDKRKREKQLEKERERREIERREREREKREREEAERAEKERLAALAKQRELELEQERERQRQAEEAARLEAEQKAKEQEAKLAAERAREAERKKREELEALKERNRKERERKMLENLEAEEKRKKEKRERDLELEKEREQKQRAERERLESLQQEQELERQRQAHLQREAEQRRHLPFGIRNAQYGAQSLEQMHSKLPLIARAFKKSAVPRSTPSAAASRAASPDPDLPSSTSSTFKHPFMSGDLSSYYLIDIQIALLLGVPSIYQAYPELSKKLVTDQEKSKLWSLVTPWMCRPLDPYADDMPSADEIMAERQEDRKRFSGMTFFWLKMDQVVDIMRRNHPGAFQLYSDPQNVALVELEYEMADAENEGAGDDVTLLPPRIRAKHEALMRSRSWDVASLRGD